MGYHEERSSVRLVPRSRRTLDLPKVAPLSLCAVVGGAMTKVLDMLGADAAAKHAAGLSLIAAALAGASCRWRGRFACAEVSLPTLLVVRIREAGYSEDTE